MINKIRFQNYKAFSGPEELELRPVTLIIGKNSSGKSSVLKLFPLLASMINEDNWIPRLNINGVSYGGSYQDLFHCKSNSGLSFGIDYENGLAMDVEYMKDPDGLHIYRYQISYAERELKGQMEERQKAIEFPISTFRAASNLSKNELVLDIDYIGPLRIMAPSNIRFHGFSAKQIVGYDGSGAYDILLNSYLKKTSLFLEVSKWMENHLEGQRVDFSNSSNNSGNYTLWVKRKGADVNIAEVGQGIAQVLPAITLALSAKANSINVMEQPELHLHPAAHAHVAELIGTSAKQNHSTFVIESHSKNMLLGFKKMIVDKKVDFHPDDIAIYFVKEVEEGSTLQRIHIDENGEFDDWPLGVFSESFELTREINKLLR